MPFSCLYCINLTPRHIEFFLPTPVFLPGESQDGGAWWAAIYGVAQSRTWLKRLSSSSSMLFWMEMLLFFLIHNSFWVTKFFLFTAKSSKKYRNFSCILCPETFTAFPSSSFLHRGYICFVQSVSLYWHLCVCSGTKSCLTLCNPMVCRLPGPSFQGILQARILDYVAIFFSGGFSWHRDWTHISYIPCVVRRIFPAPLSSREI